MLFEQRLRDGLHDGTITVAYRRWRRSQVLAGHRYRTGRDLVRVEAVDRVEVADIDAAAARDAGYGAVPDLLRDLRGGPEVPLYRIRFRRLDERDPRDELAAAAALTRGDVTAVAARLDRMDAASRRGPWTAEVLSLIAARPATSSVELASVLDWERQDLKRHIRRLKELGLTISLEVGYRLSPRGEAYLRAAGDRRPAS
jgi:biotin operon repressor